MSAAKVNSCSRNQRCGRIVIVALVPGDPALDFTQRNGRGYRHEAERISERRGDARGERRDQIAAGDRHGTTRKRDAASAMRDNRPTASVSSVARRIGPVLLVDDYDDARACVRDQRFALIILDLQMPVMDGWQLLELLPHRS
jgi:hypothetical protein